MHFAFVTPNFWPNFELEFAYEDFVKGNWGELNFKLKLFFIQSIHYNSAPYFNAFQYFTSNNKVSISDFDFQLITVD